MFVFFGTDSALLENFCPQGVLGPTSYFIFLPNFLPFYSCLVSRRSFPTVLAVLNSKYFPLLSAKLGAVFLRREGYLALLYSLNVHRYLFLLSWEVRTKALFYSTSLLGASAEKFIFWLYTRRAYTYIICRARICKTIFETGFQKKSRKTFNRAYKHKNVIQRSPLVILLLKYHQSHVEQVLNIQYFTLCLRFYDHFFGRKPDSLQLMTCQYQEASLSTILHEHVFYSDEHKLLSWCQVEPRSEKSSQLLLYEMIASLGV